MAEYDLQFDRLSPLLAALCEGTLRPAEQADLERLLAADPVARRLYIAYMDLHGELHWNCRPVVTPLSAAEQTAAPLPAAEAPPLPGFLGNFLRMTGDTPGAAALMWLVMAMCTAMTLGVMVLVVLAVRGIHVTVEPRQVAKAPAASSTDHRPPTTDHSLAAASVARLTRVADCQWLDAETAPSPGDNLAPGRLLQLKTGLAEIVFRDGAKVLLQGPAEMKIGSRSSAFLSHGSLTATVEDPLARGFEIHTRGMKYTDLGTEFGVLVAQDGVQEVHVFRGTVEAVVSGQWSVVSAKNQNPPFPPGEGRGEGGAGNDRSNGVSSSSSDHRPLTTDHSAPLLLTANQAIRVAAPEKPIEHIVASSEHFVRNAQFSQILEEQAPAFRRWKTFATQLCQRPDLVAYYDFQPEESDRSVLRNRAATGRQFDGRLEGGPEWVAGRMPGKFALRFDKHDAGVRVNLPIASREASFAAWTLIDPSPNIFGNVVVMSNGWNQRPEQVCFQITRAQGWIGLGVVKFGVDLHSPSVFSSDGHNGWHFLAGTLSPVVGKACIYLDGRLVAETAMHAGPDHYLGEGMIGNWDHQGVPPADKRPFGGCIEELMVFSTALSAAEIQHLYEFGVR